MKVFSFVCLALVMLPALASAESKEKKPKVAEAVGQAHLVFVQSVDGEETKRGLTKEDMQAIANIRSALRVWGRYTVIDDRSKADLIFLVHTARRRQGDSGDVFGRSPQGGGSGIGANPNDMPAPQGGQFGSGRDSGLNVNDYSAFDVDRLEVCQLKPNGKLTHPLWSRTMENGLNPQRLPLFVTFRDEVEKAFPTPAANAPQPENR